MNKHRRPKLAIDEESIQRSERDNEIFYGIREIQHPHEKQFPVGEDPREYLLEELNEQGYTDEGLIHRGDDEEERPQTAGQRSLKLG